MATSVNAGARLDRLPVSSFHYRVFWLIGAGMFFDGYDLYVAGSVLAATINEKFSTLPQNLQFISFTFVGMTIGALLTGFLGDWMGRRFTYQVNLLVFGLASLAAAFAQDMTQLIICRFVQGLGLGAEIVVGYSTLTEFAPPKTRDRWLSLMVFIVVAGFPATSLLGYLIVPTWGWRPLFVIAGVGALIVWYLRKALPESPRWLEAQGRTAEAEALMQSIEAEAGKAGPLPPPMVVSDNRTFAKDATIETLGSAGVILILLSVLWWSVTFGPALAQTGDVSKLLTCVIYTTAQCSTVRVGAGWLAYQPIFLWVGLGCFIAAFVLFERRFGRNSASPASPDMMILSVFKPPILQRILVGSWTLITINTLIFGFVIFLPQFFLRQGLTITNSLGYTVVLAAGSLVGCAVGAYTSDHFGRRWSIIGASLAVIVLGWIYAGFSAAADPVIVLSVGFFLIVAIYVQTALLFGVYTPELFPTEIRLRANGICNTVGRAATVVSPFIVGALMTAYQLPGVIGLMIGLLVVQIIVVWGWGVEPAQRPLEALDTSAKVVA